MQGDTIEEQVKRLLAEIDEGSEKAQEQLPGTEPTDGLQDVYVLIVRQREEEASSQVVDSTPAPVTPQQDSFLSVYVFVCFSLFLIVCTLAFQFYCIANPLTATVTILPKTRQVTLTGTLQLGRLVQPITISQSQTVATTGKGHQDAKAARGTLTFYNGSFSSQTVDAGTVFTGADGVQVVTEETVSIPANTPPQDGQARIAAQALQPGSKGNIPALDINGTFSGVLFVKNLASFIGGQDERNFQTVAKSDINTAATSLKPTVAQSINGALQGQLKTDEQLYILPCRPTVTSDHSIGQEATQINVTVSQTCSAVAYSSQELETKATALLIHQSATQPGAEYSLFGTVQVSVKQASVSHTTTPLVFLSFSASGTWVYGLSQQAQEQIKHLIAGKTTQEAVQLLAALPGVEQASIRFTGFGDATKLPKQSSLIHLAFVVM